MSLDCFSSIRDYANLADVLKCIQTSAEVSCFRNHLEVCYRPPTIPPYNRLSTDLANHKALAFVTDARPDLAFDDTCVLTPTAKQPFSFAEELSSNGNESSKEGALWCLTLDWRKDPGRPSCAVRVTEYMSGHLYSGYLAIVTDADDYHSPMRNLLFHFTCKTNNEIPQQVPGQVFERVWESEYHGSGAIWSKVDVSLDLVNQTGQTLETAFEYTPVRLRAQLNDRAAKYHALHMEACYASQAPVDDQDSVESQEYPMVIKGCPARVMTGRLGSTVPETRPSALAGLLESPTRFETELFPVSHDASSQVFCLPPDGCPKGFSHPSTQSLKRSAFLSPDAHTDVSDFHLNGQSKFRVHAKSGHLRPVEYKVHRLRFRCVIRLCIERAWCCWPVACGSRPGDSVTPRTSFQPPNMRFITRSVHLNVLQWIAATHEPARTKSKEDQCTNFLCTTGLHTLLLIGLVGLLTCVMGIIGLMLARRYQNRHEGTSYTHNNNHVPPKSSNHAYRQPIEALPGPDLLNSSTLNKSIRSGRLSDGPVGNHQGESADANWWLTLHAYSNAQLNDSLPRMGTRANGNDHNRLQLNSTSNNNNNSHNTIPTFLSLPRCSCSETGSHVASVNIGSGSHVPPVPFTPSSPVNLTSFQTDVANRKAEHALLFAPAHDSTTSSLRGVTYLQLTDPDRMQSVTNRSTPSEVTWTPWATNGQHSDDCSSAPSKEYPCVIARGVPPGGESSSAYSTCDRRDTFVRT
ncbi:unnamed protein product [Echinostoma caproni]|uniref:ZP domain-containing protein n=1 Tax=Echinostoma caproni TaxID=27848 RepID=A0A183A580_9TREM|nr:unnamed protein product [Echinostoma caproni]